MGECGGRAEVADDKFFLQRETCGHYLAVDCTHRRSVDRPRAHLTDVPVDLFLLPGMVEITVKALLDAADFDYFFCTLIYEFDDPLVNRADSVPQRLQVLVRCPGLLCLRLLFRFSRRFFLHFFLES